MWWMVVVIFSRIEEWRGYFLGGKVLLRLLLSFFLLHNGSFLPSITSYFEEHKIDTQKSSIIVDSHVDTLSKIIDDETWLPTTDIGNETSFESDIPKLRSGGIHVPFMAAYTPGFYNNHARSLSHTLAMINALYWTETNNPNDLKITQETDEIFLALNEGKIAAVPTIEGAYSLSKLNAIELLRQYHDLGIKAIGFTWNYSNVLGEGAHKIYDDQMRTPSSGGLTKLGQEVALEMNKLGMMIDVSHMAESTFWDILEISKAPVIATHSGVHALNPHARNLTDDQLLALAEKGGVIGIVFYPAFLNSNGQATISDVVDHIDYAVNLIGIDHVAIGTDLDGATLPSDMQDATEIYKLTNELTSRGYSALEISKILASNTLRVMREVEEMGDDQGETDHIEVSPTYEMGQTISDKTPLLTAKLNDSMINADDLFIILDGISYPATFNNQTLTMSYQVTESLEEKFHVVTFVAGTMRETRIFYVD